MDREKVSNEKEPKEVIKPEFTYVDCPECGKKTACYMKEKLYCFSCEELLVLKGYEIKVDGEVVKSAGEVKGKEGVLSVNDKSINDKLDKIIKLLEVISKRYY